MMKLSEQGLALIMEFEGFCATSYLCPAGKPTIGYGHVILENEQFPAQGINQEDAKILLKQDVVMAGQAGTRFVTVPLQQHEFDALVSLVYNIGSYAFEKSSLLRILNAENRVLAAGQFTRWIYANGKKIAGLERRRCAEKALFTGKLRP